MIAAYKHFKNIDLIAVVKIQNLLKSELRRIIINFIYQRQIIGEIEIRSVSKPPTYYTNRFLQKLTSAETVP